MHREAMEPSFYLRSVHIKKGLVERARAKENNQDDRGLGNKWRRTQGRRARKLGPEREKGRNGVIPWVKGCQLEKGTHSLVYGAEDSGVSGRQV